MDNIIKNHPNNPDDDGIERDEPTASDVADNIMNNQVSDYDISDLMSDEVQAECFRELVGIWVSRGRLDMDKLLATIDMINFMEKALTEAAKRNGFS